MPKLHTQYVCQQCSRVTVKPFGRCPSCGGYNTMVEEVVDLAPVAVGTGRGLTGQSHPQKMNEVSGDPEERLSLRLTNLPACCVAGLRWDRSSDLLMVVTLAKSRIMSE
jgi:DNA repair protein RadA/Sms